MTHIRAFIAVEIDDSVKEQLVAMQIKLRQAGAEVAWVRPEAMHLTLKFLGDIPEDGVPALGAALGEIAARHAPFRITAIGLSAFPRVDRPRVVWAGITDGARELTALAEEIEAALEALGYPRSDKPFQPHLTLGRVKGGEHLDRLARAVAAAPDTPFGESDARAVRLMRSELLHDGPRYTVLAEARLVP
jgi:2'-5' RNA ligase